MVRRANRHRLEFDAAAIYQYPEHLRQWLEGLPNQPGVYTFHGDNDNLPLYIGKSINLRSRVMAHFRTADEASMLRQARRVSWIPTAGDVGAQLLEAQMIKTQQPLFNKRLRKNRQLCSLQLGDGAPQVVYARDLDFSSSPDLYGLFRSRFAALEKLKSLADELRLCHGLLGLERLQPGRGCFRAALKRCAGACCGAEPLAAHQERLLAGLEQLRVVCWPWRGPVGMVERGTEMTQIHVIDHWFWLGSVSSEQEARQLQRARHGFDHDGYKILCRPLLSGVYPLIEL
ncbi:excinuclease Cho [Pantoea sp. ICBG 828]|uniref:excinuclease Cho n=1 Tax=unclassified Pantoea TaxID=2630326 RepID=UPI000CE3CCFB|nr:MULTISPECIES: excinuclease Cho [unclassified Pantoea]NIG32653.1 excinuclease Cho [Pantoea sp. Ap-959]PPC70438.1 excinuclease Cho [Pantoea sp. ICBG 828]